MPGARRACLCALARPPVLRPLRVSGMAPLARPGASEPSLGISLVLLAGLSAPSAEPHRRGPGLVPATLCVVIVRSQGSPTRSERRRVPRTQRLLPGRVSSGNGRGFYHGRRADVGPVVGLCEGDAHVWASQSRTWASAPPLLAGPSSAGQGWGASVRCPAAPRRCQRCPSSSGAAPWAAPRSLRHISLWRRVPRSPRLALPRVACFLRDGSRGDLAAMSGSPA